MEVTRHISIMEDKENGIISIPLRGTNVAETKSLLDEGIVVLRDLGADVVLHFDEDGKLAELELMGFDV